MDKRNIKDLGYARSKYVGVVPIKNGNSYEEIIAVYGDEQTWAKEVLQKMQEAANEFGMIALSRGLLKRLNSQTLANHNVVEGLYVCPQNDNAKVRDIADVIDDSCSISMAI